MSPRRILDGILFKLTSGVPWHSIPASYASGPVCRLYYSRWRSSGLLRRIINRLLTDLRTRGAFDCAAIFRQGSVRLVFEHDHYEIFFHASLLGTWQVSTSLLFYQRLARRVERTFDLPLHTDPLTSLFEPSDGR